MEKKTSRKLSYPVLEAFLKQSANLVCRVNIEKLAFHSKLVLASAFDYLSKSSELTVPLDKVVKGY